MIQKQVTVTDAIRELRAQLRDAMKEGKGQAVRFAAKSIEIELAIKFSLEAETSGGFKLLSLIDLSAKGKAGDETSHKVKLVLAPVGPDGEDLEIASTRRRR